MTESPVPKAPSANEYAMDFCVACYLPDALPLIQGLLAQHAHDENFRLVLSPGPAGSFEVREGGQLRYSKARSGRLPTPTDLGIPVPKEPTIAATPQQPCCEPTSEQPCC